MLKKIFINIFVFIACLFITDCFVYILNYEYNYFHNPFQYNFGQYKKQFDNIKDFFNGEDNRLPDGLQYKNKSKHSIIVFGCSFAFGQYLQPSQTLSAKLSKLLKMPVYNRAVPGGGLQQMYKQSLSEDFYKDVSSSDIVIYVMINDHYRRMFGLPFSIYDDAVYLQYKIDSRGEFVINDNKFVNFYKSLYIYRFIMSKLVYSYIKNENNAEYLTDIVLKYFVKTRDNLEKHFNRKIKFYIIYYEDVLFQNLLTNKLKKNNFKVILSNELTKVDLNSERYKNQENMHPKESAWDLLTPLIAKKLSFD